MRCLPEAALCHVPALVSQTSRFVATMRTAQALAQGPLRSQSGPDSIVETMEGLASCQGVMLAACPVQATSIGAADRRHTQCPGDRLWPQLGAEGASRGPAGAGSWWEKAWPRRTGPSEGQPGTCPGSSRVDGLPLPGVRGEAMGRGMRVTSGRPGLPGRSTLWRCGGGPWSTGSMRLRS